MEKQNDAYKLYNIYNPSLIGHLVIGLSMIILGERIAK